MSDSPKATIHDLGYQRYLGSRRAQSTRWRVIVGNLLSMSWKGWWRYKAPLAVAVMITVGIAMGIYFSRHEIFAGQRGDKVRTVADSLIPMSYAYYSSAAFIVGLTVLASAVSRDLQAGAFEFYFSRPVRPIDYTLGKIAGAFILLAPLLMAGPLLLTIYRLAMTGDMDQTIDTLPWIPKALLVGLVATFAHASVALAFGAMSKRPRYAMAAYAAFVLVFGNIMFGIGQGADIPELGALDLSAAITGLASAVFDVHLLFGTPSPPVGASIASLVGYTSLSCIFIWYRVKSAERAGMGGG